MSHRSSSTRLLLGIHSVREALRAGAPVRWIAVNRERQDARVQELLDLARVAGVPVRNEPRAALDRMAAGGMHQGVIAQAEARPVLELEDLLAAASTPALLLALDGIEDPHNVGAILRSACATGVDGVLLTERRSAGLTETVERVSAGAMEYVRIARVPNLVRALETLKRAGYWTVGLAGEARQTLWQQDFTLPTVLVVGAEGKGLHELTRKTCDFLVSIPMAPGVSSLNASVATGLVLFEVVRQRRQKAQ